MKTKTVLQLVKAQCAYHDNESNGTRNYCATEETPDHQCIYFYNDADDYYAIRCKYFEECVLPLNKELEAIYWAKIKASESNKELTSKEIKEIKENSGVKFCTKCKSKFKPTSNRQRHCSKCKKENQKNNQKKWIKNKRKNMS